MKIAMIGAGYVGLVSGACLADFGHDVICVDSNAERVARAEPAVRSRFSSLASKELVATKSTAGRLRFTRRRSPTAVRKGRCRLHRGRHAFSPRRWPRRSELCLCRGARHRRPCSTGRTVRSHKVDRPGWHRGRGRSASIREPIPAADFAVVSNPEFLREGAAIEDFKPPDRIVIGTDDRARPSNHVARSIVRCSSTRRHCCSPSRRSAELIKYAANAFLAMKITFINEIADLCREWPAPMCRTWRAASALDNRIGSKFLNAGPGYGGSCFPKDTQALMRTAQELGRPLRLIEGNDLGQRRAPCRHGRQDRRGLRRRR